MSHVAKSGIWFTVPLFGTRRFAIYSKKKIIDKNYDLNKKEFEENKENILSKSGFIEKQDALKNMRYGTEKMAFCGCEIIAVYNVLFSLKISENGGNNLLSLPHLISMFENDGIVMCGEFGSSPFRAKKIFEELGYKSIISKDESKFDHIINFSKASIISFFNDANDIKKGVHTICISKDKGNKKIAHNIKNGPILFDNISEVISKNAGIIIIGIF